jgi:hypothetical protein
MDGLRDMLVLGAVDEASQMPPVINLIYNTVSACFTVISTVAMSVYVADALVVVTNADVNAHDHQLELVGHGANVSFPGTPATIKYLQATLATKPTDSNMVLAVGGPVFSAECQTDTQHTTLIVF